MGVLDVEVNFALSGSTAAVVYEHQEKSLAQLEIGPTQKALKSGNGVFTPILSNKHVENCEINEADPADQFPPLDQDRGTGRASTWAGARAAPGGLRGN